MYSFLSYSDMNLCTSSLSFFDNGYTFSFLGTNLSFVSITWFYSFLIDILSLAFLPKTWIHLWNLSGTSFSVSSSNFISSSSSSQISYFSAIFFIFTVLFFFSFFFLSFFSLLLSLLLFLSYFFLSFLLFLFFQPWFSLL